MSTASTTILTITTIIKSLVSSAIETYMAVATAIETTGVSTTITPTVVTSDLRLSALSKRIAAIVAAETTITLIPILLRISSVSEGQLIELSRQRSNCVIAGFLA